MAMKTTTTMMMFSVRASGYRGGLTLKNLN